MPPALTPRPGSALAAVLSVVLSVVLPVVLSGALSVALSVALALAGAVWAAAQARPAGLHAVTLCSDGGAAMLLIDARGNPAPPPLPCPDCLAALALALPPEAPTRAARRRGLQCSPCSGPGPAARPVPRPRARAPPA